MSFENSKSWRIERIILILLAGALWIFAFFPFLNGQKMLIDDAQPYYGHVKYYLDNISAGVYPLWDPVRDFGVDNEFYLRRIGEFNPAYLLILILQKCGMGFAMAHRVFLGAYFLLGAAGFYVVAKRLFKNVLTPVFVLLCVIFSSLSALAFQSYLLLIVVPQVWFLYFVLSFFRKPSKGYLLGAVLCLMIISITYIPYYFLTMALSGLLVFVIIFQKSCWPQFKECGRFLRMNKGYALCSVLLLAIGTMPGAMWYQQSSKGEMSVVYRHSGADTVNAATLHINVVNEGGIIAPKVAERMFFELDRVKPGDFYLPLFVFLLLLMGACVGISRRMLFLFCWGFLIYLIGVADAAKVHSLLYQHIFFFKYFRNLQFFLWLGCLPVIMFFLGEIFDQLMGIDLSTIKGRIIYWAYVLVVHTAAWVFFAGQEIRVVIGATYGTILFSALFFCCLPLKKDPRVGRLLPWVLLLGVACQSMSVFGYMRANTPNGAVENLYIQDYMRFSLPDSTDLGELLKDQSPARYLNQPYYSSKEFQDMYQNMNRSVLSLYIKPRLLFYDEVSGIDKSTADWDSLSDSFALMRNKAFVLNEQLSLIHQVYRKQTEMAAIVTKSSTEAEVVFFGADRLKLKTKLNRPRFLVYNNVYHSQWRALLDGRSVPVLRANYAFMGVEVPAGEHELEFIYGKPWRQWLGFGTAIVFLLTFIGLMVQLHRQRR